MAPDGRVVSVSILLILAVLAGHGNCWWPWDNSVTIGVVIDSEAPTAYRYPSPAIIDDMVDVTTFWNNSVFTYIKTHPWMYAVIGGTALIIVTLIVAITSICCYYCYCRRRTHQRTQTSDSPQFSRPPDFGTSTSPTEQRRVKEQRQKEAAEVAARAVEEYIKDNQNNFETDSKSNCSTVELGSRMQKFWFRVEPKPFYYDTELLITAAPVSKKCPLELNENTLRGIKKILQAIHVHPYIHRILDIDLRFKLQQVIIVQPVQTYGSLKDMIYDTSPLTEWSRKYSRRNKGLNVERVKRFGRQVLEAMTFLYEKGFPILGHVQSGNIFVIGEDKVRLGGYENTMLGYKTRLYRLCSEHLENFDIIMFGHLVFEMMCGYELTHLRPGLSERRTIPSGEQGKILDYIFAEGFPHGIDKIKKHEFFDVSGIQCLFNPVVMSDHMNRVLEKVRKGKQRTQPTEQAATSIAKEKATVAMGKASDAVKKATTVAMEKGKALTDKLKHGMKKSDSPEEAQDGAMGEEEIQHDDKAHLLTKDA